MEISGLYEGLTGWPVIVLSISAFFVHARVIPSMGSIMDKKNYQGSVNTFLPFIMLTACGIAILAGINWTFNIIPFTAVLSLWIYTLIHMKANGKIKKKEVLPGLVTTVLFAVLSIIALIPGSIINIYPLPVILLYLSLAGALYSFLSGGLHPADKSTYRIPLYIMAFVPASALEIIQYSDKINAGRPLVLTVALFYFINALWRLRSARMPGMVKPAKKNLTVSGPGIKIDVLDWALKDMKSQAQLYGNHVNALKESLDDTCHSMESDKTVHDHLMDMIRSHHSVCREACSTLESQMDRMKKVIEQTGLIQNILSQIPDQGSSVSSGVINLNMVIDSAKKNADASLTMIREIKRAIDRIEVHTRSVDKIAEQSGILAMNSSIESANTGGLGQGFLVVAENLRKMADMTRRETESLRQVLIRLKKELPAGIEATRIIRSFFMELELTVESIFSFVLKIIENAEDLNNGIETTKSKMGALNEGLLATNELFRFMDSQTEEWVNTALKLVEARNHVYRVFLEERSGMDELVVAYQGVTAAADMLESACRDREKVTGLNLKA